MEVKAALVSGAIVSPDVALVDICKVERDHLSPGYIWCIHKLTLAQRHPNPPWHVLPSGAKM